MFKIKFAIIKLMLTFFKKAKTCLKLNNNLKSYAIDVVEVIHWYNLVQIRISLHMSTLLLKYWSFDEGRGGGIHNVHK